MERLKSSYTVLTVVIFMLVSVLMLVVVSRGSALSRLLIEKHEKLKVLESMDNTSDELIDLINGDLGRIAEEVYTPILSEVKDSQDEYTDKEAAADFFREYEERVRRRYGDGRISHTLNEYLSGLGKQDNTVRHMSITGEPRLNIKYDNRGRISGCSIDDLFMDYRKNNESLAQAKYNKELAIPSPYFYSGNDDLFSYSVIAMKGIYFTGRTSSVIGNVYAGSHKRSEKRDAEIIYGERGNYGGINFLSTQAVLSSDKIVSDADINVKSSYVVFGTDYNTADIYARSINEIEGYNLDNTVIINGDYSEDISAAVPASEMKQIGDSIEGMSLLYDYYDSDNDKEYKGAYRKILSNYDVILSEDFTGVLLTSGNVIIEANVNVEGCIIALDRVYVQGNNDIVANKDISARIIEYEAWKEENDIEEETDEYAVSHDIKDYIDNIQYQGLFM
ncbi:MAG: hypothetical protein K6B28_08560 [Lachnospiraceae bacterium]|nr:hypothetical protein [Lachnospiraceae bacterium]